MDAEVLAERILSDLKNTLKKDSLIDEFDILPDSDSVCNKCPVIHIDHKVALEGWCVKHVYLYAYSKFMKWRQHPSKVDLDVLLSWTSAVLLINPDLETAWNARKELIKHNPQLSKEELRFSQIVLSRKPKSSQVFAHRKWVLLEYMKSNPPHCLLNLIIQHELLLCGKSADQYSNNYYAWNHRMWVVQHLYNFCLQVLSGELKATEHFVTTHVSDHSGFHYRQFLMSCTALANQSFGSSQSGICILHNSSVNDNPINCSTINNGDVSEESINEHFNDLLLKELALLNKLQLSFIGHESLWNHRRFIIVKLVEMPVAAKSLSVWPNCTEDFSFKKYKLEPKGLWLDDWGPEKEEKFLCDCLQMAKDNEWESKLISRHVAWLKKSVCWTISLPCTPKCMSCQTEF